VCAFRDYDTSGSVLYLVPGFCSYWSRIVGVQNCILSITPNGHTGSRKS
jgi:hypothetical protein